MQTKLDLHTAQLIAHDLIAAKPAAGASPLRIWLVQGVEQGPPTATVQEAALTYHLHQTASGQWALPSATQASPVKAAPVPKSGQLVGIRLANVAPAVGLDFRQDSFRYGISNDYTAMMGGGVCWLDYNGDGWQDLFAVNSYASGDMAQLQKHGGLPRTQLFENVHGRFRNVTAGSHAGLQVQGDGCVAADLNGDGRPDLIVTTTNGIKLLWNNGNGTFSEGARAAGMTASGWYTGAAVADVNGDGRPDVFVAGYARPNEPVPNSLAGFPTNLARRPRPPLPERGERPRTAAPASARSGSRRASRRPSFSHGLGATFLDVNGDGRPDLYVANDEDPNQLYVNVPWPGGAKADPAGLGFRFENRAAAAGVADPYAGMGVAVERRRSGAEPARPVRDQLAPRAFRRIRAGRAASTFANARPDFDPALGAGFAGWGDSFVDLGNSGSPDLVLATGGIPVTNLKKDAGPVKVVAPISDQGSTDYGVATGVAPAGVRLNGRGLAAADVDNDGRMEIAVNSIGGKLLLLKPIGPIGGHWLDVRLSRFSPGAVVTVVCPSGKTTQSQEVRAGGSYLSSEDQQLHFGLGSDTRAASLSVRYPWGGETILHNVRADRVVDVKVAATPCRARSRHLRRTASRLCTPATGGRSIATVWDEDGGRRAPIGRRERAGAGARPLRPLDSAIWNAWKASARKSTSARNAAISYAAYRVLLWDASFDSNLSRTFALLTNRLRALCYSPDFSTTARSSPAALGQPDRRRRDRRRPARRLERVAALRRPDASRRRTSP